VGSPSDPNRKSRSAVYIISVLLLLNFVALLIYDLDTIYAVDFFSRHEAPFEKTYDDWLSEYWNWLLSLTLNDAPKPGGCLVHESGPMVMLSGANLPLPHPEQYCEISSQQGILIPLWIAWCDDNSNADRIDESAGNLDVQLTKCAREAYNLGEIKANLKVDGTEVARLDVVMSLSGDSLVYNNKTQKNVNELFTKGFNLTIPPDQIIAPPPLKAGTFLAGSHGWWIFLEPLPPGNHTLFYELSVCEPNKSPRQCPVPEGTNFRYLMNVS